MSRRIFQLVVSTAPFGLMSVARWMLVLMLAIDLIGSPFHAHQHDGGVDGLSIQTTHIASDHAFDLLDGDLEKVLHVEAADAAHFSHSLIALRGASVELASLKFPTELPALVPMFAFTDIVTQPTAAALVRWRSGREQVPIPLFRTIPPDGRAPPSLHV